MQIVVLDFLEDLKDCARLNKTWPYVVQPKVMRTESSREPPMVEIYDVENQTLTVIETKTFSKLICMGSYACAQAEGRSTWRTDEIS